MISAHYVNLIVSLPIWKSYYEPHIKNDKMTINPRGLTDKERAVVATMRMRLTLPQSLAYMKGEGFPASQASYYRIKSWIKKTQLQRLHYIAGFGFEQQHLERIDICELMAQLHWQNFQQEKNPYKKSMILREIRELQPFISTYYDITRQVVERNNGNGSKNNIVDFQAL